MLTQFVHNNNIQDRYASKGCTQESFHNDKINTTQNTNVALIFKSCCSCERIWSGFLLSNMYKRAWPF